jgi:hypothetical protein
MKHYVNSLPEIAAPVNPSPALIAAKIKKNWANLLPSPSQKMTFP